MHAFKISLKLSLTIAMFISSTALISICNCSVICFPVLCLHHASGLRARTYLFDSCVSLTPRTVPGTIIICERMMDGCMDGWIKLMMIEQRGGAFIWQAALFTNSWTFVSGKLQNKGVFVLFPTFLERGLNIYLTSISRLPLPVDPCRSWTKTL